MNTDGGSGSAAVDPRTRLDRGFLDRLAALSPSAREAPADDAPLAPPHPLTVAEARRLFEAQLGSRHLDFAARWLRGRGVGYYTIGSSGHEGNAAVALAIRPTDPAFLHYRSGAFFLARALQVGYANAERDVLLGMTASRDEPIAGGRHKVFGNLRLAMPPQTSTIASHLPKAMGLSVAIGLKSRLGLPPRFPEDAIVVCSFGDASLNHSTALGAINTACCLAYQHLKVPLLFVCEDNGLGISVPTPSGWVRQVVGAGRGLAYFAADGCDLVEAHDAAKAAAEHVRRTRQPAFLHLRTVRLMGHAGSDVELSYRPMSQIRAEEDADPVRRSAERLIAHGVMTPDQVCEAYEGARRRIHSKAEQAAGQPQLADADDVMWPLAWPDPEAVAAEVARPVHAASREAIFGARLPETEGPLALAQALNRTLGDLLAKYPELLLFGEDVGQKGGVYGVTRGLLRRAGPLRVFDTVLDEQSILGFAIGAGHAGLLPIPEIQYLAYLHNAEDQVRGEAATLKFFSQSQFHNPMVVRIASYAYQKGFGGHFHNDNSVAVLRDIPGLVIASPSRGDDAAAMLRTCVAAARVDGAVCAFLEPIALYGTRDLHEPGDAAWTAPYDPEAAHVPLGRARTYGDGEDLLLVSFANGVPMALRAARRLATSSVSCRVLDLRWLAPFPLDDVVREARRAGRVLVVDETRKTGGVAEGVLAALLDAGFRGPMARVASRDSLIPLGPAADHVLLTEQAIVEAARALARV